jgi:hypothetical protein
MSMHIERDRFYKGNNNCQLEGMYICLLERWARANPVVVVDFEPESHRRRR